MLTRIDVVWHFTQSSDTLFSDKTFLQYQQEARGYSAHAVTEAENRACIDWAYIDCLQDYFAKEEIRLKD